MLLEDMIEARLKERLAEGARLTAGGTNHGSLYNLIFQPWITAADEFGRGRLHILAQGAVSRAQSITVEDLKYDRQEDANRFAGTARVVIDVVSSETGSTGTRVLGGEEIVRRKIRFTLRQLNRWTKTFDDGSRILNVVPLESGTLYPDSSGLVVLGFAAFEVRFVESEDLTIFRRRD